MRNPHTKRWFLQCSRIAKTENSSTAQIDVPFRHRNSCPETCSNPRASKDLQVKSDFGVKQGLKSGETPHAKGLKAKMSQPTKRCWMRLFFRTLQKARLLYPFAANKLFENKTSDSRMSTTQQKTGSLRKFCKETGRYSCSELCSVFRVSTRLRLGSRRRFCVSFDFVQKWDASNEATFMTA